MKTRMLLLPLMLIASAVASAHAKLESSSPADKSRVAAPAAVELKFNEAVKLTALTLQRGQETAQPLKPLPGKAGATLSVPLPKLEAGDYVVAWRVAGDDGHVMSGTLAFTVDPNAKTAAPGTSHSMHDGMAMGDHDHMDQAGATSQASAHDHQH